jgi:hypothetical protein
MEVSMSKGNLQKSYTKVTSTDNNLDGVPDSFARETFIFNKKGLLVEQRYESDWRGEGEEDWGGDGNPDYSAITKNTYDRQGHLVQSVSTVDYDGNEVPDEITTVKNTYQKGNLVKIETLPDYNADGNIDGRSITEHTYSKNGLLTDTVNSYDWEPDGTFNQVDSIHYTYDRGELVKEEYDFWNDGIVDTTVTYEPFIA